jgi:hypothetical protein
MKDRAGLPKAGDAVVLKELPPGLLDGLPPEDQSAISEVLELVLRLAMGELAHLGLDGLGEGLEGFLDGHSLDYVRIILPVRVFPPQRVRRA